MEHIHIEENNNFYCEKCNFKCKYKFYYDRHLTTSKHINGKIIRKTNNDKIKNIKKYTCEKCDFISTHLYNYKTHLLNNHSTEEEKQKEFPFYCICCKIGLFAETLYNKHLLSKKHLRKSK
jgi:hypothetical protein